MEIVKHLSIIKAISKKYHLTFCTIHRYYEGDAYKNDKGENLPHYFGHGGRVYALKYFSGCFHPFLVEVTHTIGKMVDEATERMNKAELIEDKERIEKYIKYLKTI
jgi:hypothetical protein